MIPASAVRRGSSSNPTRKRPRSDAHPAQSDEALNCSFCGQVPAAVSVKLPVLLRKKRAPTPYCLACYYTTSAVRQDPAKYASVCDQEQLDEQLTPMQQLFSEAYVDLQKQLQAESERAFSKQKSDPLAMLHSGSGLAPRRMAHRGLKAPKPESEKKKEGDRSDGGFLRSVPLPERLLRTQKEQARLQQAQIARMNQMAAGPTNRESSSSSFATANPFGTGSVYQRRKSSKKSIWNLAMDPNTKDVDAKEGEEAARLMEDTPACSCGSKNVRAFGTITSRNQDLKKGETWGMKDRGSEVVSRYQCNECGKMWNEEG